MTKWLKRAVAMREVSGSSPGRGRHTYLYERREPSDYIRFRRAVKRQRFHTHDTKPRTTQQHSLQMPYTLELDLGPFPPDVACSFSSRLIAPSVVFLRKRFPPTT